MLRQALADHLVSLSMPGITRAEWHCLGALTSLTHLETLTGFQDGDISDSDDGQAAEMDGIPIQAFAPLTRLCSLHLFGAEIGVDRDMPMKNVNLGPCTRLTNLDICEVADSFALASTATSLRTLVICNVHSHPIDQLAVDRWCGLTCLTHLTLKHSMIGNSELQCVKSLRGLKELCLDLLPNAGMVDMPCTVAALFAGLRRLTSLTRLHLQNLWYVTFLACHIGICQFPVLSCCGATQQCRLWVRCARGVQLFARVIYFDGLMQARVTDGGIACRAPRVNLAQLGGLSQLQSLEADSVAAHDFKIPCTWIDLRRLEMRGIRLTQLPSNLSALSSPTHLSVQNCVDPFKIRAPLDFLTQIKTLRVVDLRPSFGHADRWAWNAESLFALMRGRMLLDSKPGFKVELLDT